MEITLDRMRHAYRHTETAPAAGKYYRTREHGAECCVLTVLYLERFGHSSVEALMNNIADDWSYDPVPVFVRDLEISLDLANGIIDGFDGNDRFVSCPESSVTDPAEYEQGYRLGVQARQEFITEEATA